MTDKEQQLHNRAATGPIAVFAIDFRTARRLERKGHGRTVSNPGSNYTGYRIDRGSTRGGYYIQNGWTWNNETKAFEGQGQ
jgi:hypothetical protein